MISDAMLTRTASNYRPTHTTTSTGGQTTAFGSAVATFACAFQPRADGQKVMEAGRVTNGEWVLYANQPLDLRKNDRVVISGVNYEALEVDDESGLGEHWKASLTLDRRL